LKGKQKLLKPFAKVPGKIQEGKTKMQTKIKKDYEKPN